MEISAVWTTAAVVMKKLEYLNIMRNIEINRPTCLRPDFRCPQKPLHFF